MQTHTMLLTQLLQQMHHTVDLTTLVLLITLNNTFLFQLLIV